MAHTFERQFRAQASTLSSSTFSPSQNPWVLQHSVKLLLWLSSVVLFYNLAFGQLPIASDFCLNCQGDKGAMGIPGRPVSQTLFCVSYLCHSLPTPRIWVGGDNPCQVSV